ncbi:cadherin-99C-like [Macrosteles quadrilineatus]|uniref:cadherin-99C-like n=1 Tax=Macrosteles quadrilineatus TaxID=74068 RepID=UPI0023E23FE3|nr:cadherin-99C-like [Macrosteles quadrilineatus]
MGRWLVEVLCLLLLFKTHLVLAQTGLCEVENGQSNIIMDIEESRENEVGQATTPSELPISGDPLADISLDLVFPKGNPYFTLQGKKLQLLSPLDRDKDNLSHIVFQLTCTVRSTRKKKTVPVIVRVVDVNDNPPIFINTPYNTTISELVPVGTTIFRGLKAVDRDAGVNSLVEYSIIPGDGRGVGTDQGVGRSRVTVADGYGYFAINLPHQGQVTVNRSLDYEKTQRYLLTVVATDRARNESERFSTTTTLTVNVRDDDDQDPSFIYRGCMSVDGACVNPEYHATVSSGVRAGILSVSPEKIQAVDMDTNNSPIIYSFLSGTPGSFREYFEINPSTGAVQQIRAVDTSVTKRFEIIVKAEEKSASRRFATAKLIILVRPVDVNPPVIAASATDGFVDENAPVGTRIIDKEGNPILLSVSDPDLGADDPKPDYDYEVTTNFFHIDEEGNLVVGQENLDRDPPNPGKFRFQVVARERHGTAASSPVTFTVELNDINDNAPHMPMIPPISIQAGEGRRQVVKVEATDRDVGENAEISYSIYHVSNNGRNKFKIDPSTGAIEVNGKLNAGEQYSITVQATDSGGKSSQTIVEVTVVPGPNTRSPVFQESTYHVTISEGAPINSTVANIVATDPENEPVTYSIVSGNDLRQFAINDKTGVLSVIRKLDREDLTRYELVIKAEDEGGLSSTANVNIVVSDINDKNPEFTHLPYEFTVTEGVKDVFVGQVTATDADEGMNANVTYSLPEDVPFTIDTITGNITTQTALDYEKNKEFKFVVTAQDGAPDPRIATATVTVHVTDVEDELPTFPVTLYNTTVPENTANYLVAQVKAEDLDTNKSITYVIKQGPQDLFKIDKKTGEIRTARGLDYETENQYALIIGTEENPNLRPGATTKVIIMVEDQNDVPPVFLTILTKPIVLNDDTEIGSLVTTLAASDADGTAPNNIVRYDIVGKGEASRFFEINQTSGELRVKDDFRKEPDNEYEVEVRAYDSGEPELSSSMTVPVYIRRTTTVTPDIGPGFADTLYTIEVPEDTKPNSTVKTFTIIKNQKQPKNLPLHCSISKGNTGGVFSVRVTEDRNCELRLVAALDREETSEYQLTLQLDTGLLVNNTNAITSTSVKIQVLDVNDNIPVFLYPESSRRFKKEKYFGGVAADRRDVGAHVLDVKAEDKDAGKLGQVEYRLIPDETGAVDYFSIDPRTGVVRTKRTLDSVGREALPFRLTVEARDSPGVSRGYNTAATQIVVNVIEDIDRMILVINNMPADEVEENREKVVTLLEQHSNLLVGVEQMVPRQWSRDNLTLDTDQFSTDVWFYVVDPDTELIQGRNTSVVKRSLTSKEAQSDISEALAAALHVGLFDIHPPLRVTPVRTTFIQAQWEVFPYALVAIAALIMVLGIAGIIYICISWSRYRAYKERMQRMYVTPHYDPVFVEPSLKEYETQVLQMSVPVDDNDSFNDLQLDFSNKNHTFNLDNVGYISKELNETLDKPVVNTMTRTATIGRQRSHHNNNNNIHRSPSGVTNPAYDRSGDTLSRRNTSPSNDNVTFRGKKDYSHLGFNYLVDRNSVEATTEL